MTPCCGEDENTTTTTVRTTTVDLELIYPHACVQTNAFHPCSQ